MGELVAFFNNLTDFFSSLLSSSSLLFDAEPPPKKPYLLVHSSLSSFHPMPMAAATVLEALRRSCKKKDATLVMPSFSDTPDPAQAFAVPFVYNKRDTTCRAMGALPELFRKTAGIKRSNHPFYSFCAEGYGTKKLMSSHPCRQGLGPQSPLGSLYTKDALILMLGCSWESCTAFHLADWMDHTDTLTYTAISSHFGLPCRSVWQEPVLHQERFAHIGQDFEEHKSDNIIKGTFPGAKPEALFRLVRMRSAVDFCVDRYRDLGYL